jgi:hypothetical protein
VGFNEDYSHLNKRRQGTRDEKLKRLLAVAKMMNEKEKERQKQKLSRTSADSVNVSEAVPAVDTGGAPHVNV